MNSEYFEFLKSCFVEWSAKNSEKNTIRGLSRSSGVGKNVICDMANGVIKNSKYAFQDVSRYLKKMAVSKEVYIEFMTEYYQDFIALAEQFMLDKDEIYYSNPQVLELMTQSLACEIFQNCITKRGMSRDEIKRDYGGKGTHIVDIFLENEILRAEGCWIRHSYSENVVFDNTLSNRLIESNVAEFDLRKLGRPGCRQSILARSVDKKTLQEVEKIYSEAFDKINRLTFNESSDKDAVIFKFNFLLDTIFPNDIE